MDVVFVALGDDVLGGDGVRISRVLLVITAFDSSISNLGDLIQLSFFSHPEW
jgi:hypothetical protein